MRRRGFRSLGRESRGFRRKGRQRKGREGFERENPWFSVQLDISLYSFGKECYNVKNRFENQRKT